jgi:RIO kinase 1
LDEDFDPRTLPGAEPRSTANKLRKRGVNRSDHVIVDDILTHIDVKPAAAEGGFNPTFTGSKYERMWILSWLGPFYDDKKITDVLHRVKGGKEANVYCCAAHPDTGLELLAAKVYRPRLFRNLRNDSQYRQGRPLLDARGKAVNDRRALTAVFQGTRKGKEMQHTSWLAYEFDTLQKLHRAGASVPEPVVMGNNTILMEYVGAAGLPAPSLAEIELRKREAKPLFERLMHDVELMLSLGRIHGDLSAFNVLYWEGEVKIIDFPQAIEPDTNPDARAILARDVLRLCQYFARYDVKSDPAAITADLWARYGPAETDEPLDLSA